MVIKTHERFAQAHESAVDVVTIEVVGNEQSFFRSVLLHATDENNSASLFAIKLTPRSIVEIYDSLSKKEVRAVREARREKAKAQS